MPLPEQTPVLIFDLDGTVLRINSFPRWALRMATARVSGLRLRSRLRLAVHAQALLVSRKLARTHHDALLAALAAAWRGACGPAAEQAAADFAASLLPHVRPELRSVLDRVAQNDADAVLATAAAQEYALAFGGALGFRHVLASDAGGCNRGVRKRDRVLAYIEAHGWGSRRRIFFTDHEEDLPLIRASHGVCWFGPSSQLGRMRAEAPGVAVIAADRMLAASVIASIGPSPAYSRARASTAS